MLVWPSSEAQRKPMRQNGLHPIQGSCAEISGAWIVRFAPGLLLELRFRRRNHREVIVHILKLLPSVLVPSGVRLGAQ